MARGERGEREEPAGAVHAALIRAVDGLLLALIGDRSCHALRNVDRVDQPDGWCADPRDAASGERATGFGPRRPGLGAGPMPGVRRGMTT